MEKPGGLMNSVRAWIFAGAIFALAIALRLPNFASRSLWFDEAMAANNSRGSLTEMVANTRSRNSSPLAYPFLLYLIQKIRVDSISVRLPALVSSVSLVLCVLLLGRRLISQRAAIMAGIILVFAPSQIRYAQEAREYALCALLAGLMTYAYLDFLRRPGENRKNLRLWAILLMAPLIQYGLVLYGAALLLALMWFAMREHRIRWRDIVIAGACLASTGLFSLLMTVRYQWGVNAGHVDRYLLLGSENPVPLLTKNIYNLLAFVGPGKTAVGLLLLGLVSVAFLSSRAESKGMRALAFSACAVAVAAAAAHAYPLGPIRQCLYLAPVLVIAAAVGLDEVAFRLPARGSRIYSGVMIALLIVVGLNGWGSNRKVYAEVEDWQAVLTRLVTVIKPGDEVYVYYGAQPAVEFYLNEEQRRGFILGGYHREHPDEYAPEIISSVRSNTTRLWLVLSQISAGVEERIIHDLQVQGKGWVVTIDLAATKTALIEVRIPRPRE